MSTTIKGMGTFSALFATAFFTWSAHADVPVGYYGSVDDSTAANLRTTLHDLIDGHTGVSFSPSNPSYAAMEAADLDHGDPTQVRLIYADVTRPISGNSRSANGDETTGGYNREHAWPQSFFSSNEPMVGDIHALFSSDGDINGARSNQAYDNAISGTTDAYGNIDDNTNDLFEPQDEKKGDVARAIFYMDVRYEGAPEVDLSIIEDETLIGTGNLTMAVLSTLLQWHNDDPPSAFEVERNNRVYDIQGNANPFVDNPQWVPILYSSASPVVSNGDTVSVSGGSLAPATADQDDMDVPMLSLAVTLASNEYDIGSIDFSQFGTAADADIADVKLWDDQDNSDTVSAGDVLLAEGLFSSGLVTLTPIAPERLNGPETSNLLVTVSIASGGTPGNTIQVRATSNGLNHDARGGVDTDPTYASIDSAATTIQGSVVPNTGGVKIVMLSPRGSSGAATEEFIVLANHDATPVDLTNWELRSRAGGASSTNTTVITSGTINGFSHFVIFDDAYDATNVEGLMIPGDVNGLEVTTVVGGMGDTTNRSVALFNASGVQQDGFSLNGGATNPLTFNEGTPFGGSVSSASTESYARKRPGIPGPYTDTTDNSNDLEIVTNKTPPSDAQVPVEISALELE